MIGAFGRGLMEIVKSFLSKAVSWLASRHKSQTGKDALLARPATGAAIITAQSAKPIGPIFNFEGRTCIPHTIGPRCRI
jgi:hypothetical protein